MPGEPGSRLTYHLRKHQCGTLSTFELRVCNGGTIDVSLQYVIHNIPGICFCNFVTLSFVQEKKRGDEV